MRASEWAAGCRLKKRLTTRPNNVVSVYTFFLCACSRASARVWTVKHEHLDACMCAARIQSRKRSARPLTIYVHTHILQHQCALACTQQQRRHRMCVAYKQNEALVCTHLFNKRIDRLKSTSIHSTWKSLSIKISFGKRIVIIINPLLQTISDSVLIRRPKTILIINGDPKSSWPRHMTYEYEGWCFFSVFLRNPRNYSTIYRVFVVGHKLCPMW